MAPKVLSNLDSVRIWRDEGCEHCHYGKYSFFNGWASKQSQLSLPSLQRWKNVLVAASTRTLPNKDGQHIQITHAPFLFYLNERLYFTVDGLAEKKTELKLRCRFTNKSVSPILNAIFGTFLQVWIECRKEPRNSLKIDINGLISVVETVFWSKG